MFVFLILSISIYYINISILVNLHRVLLSFPFSLSFVLSSSILRAFRRATAFTELFLSAVDMMILSCNSSIGALMFITGTWSLSITL